MSHVNVYHLQQPSFYIVDIYMLTACEVVLLVLRL